MPAARVRGPQRRRAPILLLTVLAAAAAVLASSASAFAQGADTTTTLTVTPTSAVAGSPVTLTATVSSANGNPTGSVTFANDGTAFANVDLAAVPGSSTTSQATYTTSFPVGTFSLVAAFNGDLFNFSNSTSDPVTLTVTGITIVDTTTTLAANPNPVHAGDLVTLQAHVVQTGTQTLVPVGGLVSLFNDSAAGPAVLLGEAHLESNGTATLTVGPFLAGQYVIEADYAGDVTDHASSATILLNVVAPGTPLQVATTLTLGGATSAQFGDTATLSATLFGPSGPLSGETVTLTLGSQSCTATTTATGVATCGVVVSQAPGIYRVTASFAGDANFLPISATSSFTVTSASTTASVGVSGPVASGATLTLTGTLLHAGLPVAGQTVTLSLGSQSCTGVTAANGIASCTIVVGASLGPTTSSVTFAGNAFYVASSATAPALVFAFLPGGGAFVVGDRSATGVVTFWGAQWWRVNTLSGGPAPAAFKGFAAAPSRPVCGVSWTTDPGNSAPPPPGPLPAFMAVIVTSSVGKSGASISGSSVHLVVVQTQPGYKPDPGHAGTGIVVATVC